MPSEPQITRQMPIYKSHKKVAALKIKELTVNEDGTATFIPEEDGFAPVKLSAEYVARFKPAAGGYYVVYQDGYASWSPAKAFEEGYTRID